MTDRKKPDPDALEDIRRAVYRHKWATLEEWIRSLDELADLDYDEENAPILKDTDK